MIESSVEGGSQSGRERAPKKARFISKLDPLLGLGATRADEEKKGALGEPPALDIRNIIGFLTEEDQAGVPTSVSELPIGMQSLVDQVSPTATELIVKEDLVPVLVEVTDIAKVKNLIENWKGQAQRVSDHALLVRVPRTRLMDLASDSAVEYVEASTRLEPHCDLAHVSTGLLLDGGSTVPQVGKGVLVGVVDTGIDTQHPAFQNGSQTRIVNYFDQTLGREYSQSEINIGDAAQSPDVIGHGTHVAGIAAGNGGGSPGNGLAGVAPEADLAIVKTTFDSADIALGVAHIFDIADNRDQPCVVNLSLGGHFGAHDGTSVTERTIDELTGIGRLVVVSAGNEGSSQVHASSILKADQPTPARWVADIELSPRNIQGSLLGLLVVQVWHQHEDDLTVRLRSPSGEIFKPESDDKVEFDRGVFFVEATHQQVKYSGDHSSTFTIVTVPQSQWLSGWSIIADEDRSNGKRGVQVGAVHAWILRRAMGNFKQGFTRSHLVGMPGTAFSAITVASYATRKSWQSRDQQNQDVTLDAIKLEEISYFSSPGPTRDGYNKPEIAAPGHWLIAPLSSATPESEIPLWLRHPDIEYVALQGTSMAAPYVTGAIALLLEKNPALDWAEVKRRLMKSARQDSFTEPCWNPRWGYGKIDIRKLLTVEPE